LDYHISGKMIWTSNWLHKKRTSWLVHRITSPHK